jgi:hypothetical protein
MEPFTIRLEVASLTEDNFTAIDVLVAERISHSAFPASFLTGLGIEPNDREAWFRSLSTGEPMRRDMGPCRVRLDGRTIYHDVAFLEEGQPAQIGFVTLAEFGLELDPNGEQRFVPLIGRLPFRMPVDEPP